MTDTAADNADSSSFVEHLRLVHFTLMATCLVAIAAITSRSQSSAERAYEETIQLIDVSQQWDRGRWLKKVIENKKETLPVSLDEGLPQEPTLYIRGDSASSVLSFSVPRPGRPGLNQNRTFGSGVQFGVFDWLILATRTGQDSTALFIDELHDIKTLQDAISVWNTLNSYGYVARLIGTRDGWYINQDGEPSDLKKKSVDAEKAQKKVGNNGLQLDSIPQVDQSRGLRLYLRSDLLKQLLLWGDSPDSRKYEAGQRIITRDPARCFLASFPDMSNPTLIILRADCLSEPFFPQSLFIKSLPPQRPAPALGDFLHSFPNVDDLAKNLTALNLDQLLTHFSRERNRTGERTEVFGVKLAADSVVSWSITIIIVISVYFAAIFRDFDCRVKTNDKAWNVPWIGTSAEALSCVAFAVTMVFPIFTVGYLAFRGISSGKSLWIGIFYTVVLTAIVAIPTAGVARSWVKSLRMRTVAVGASIFPR